MLRHLIFGCSLSLCLVAFTSVAQAKLLAGLQMLPVVMGTSITLVNRWQSHNKAELQELQRIRALLEELSRPKP